MRHSAPVSAARVAALVLAVASAAALGCGKKDAVKSELVQKLEAQADAACACKDMACAEKVTADVQKLADATGKVEDDDLKPLQAAQTRIDECLGKLNPIVIAYRELSDQICACQDKACGEKVAAGVSKWAADLKTSGKKLTPGDVKVIQQIGLQAAVCFQKLGLPIPQ
ncbi:MAG: hypothetical protein IT373_25015 [Polyangiaceae bacterium]|nr:hypothetical protein [Polyangiaceae bacterium]